jgi:multiple sugar transport system substrate-binding protein
MSTEQNRPDTRPASSSSLSCARRIRNVLRVSQFRRSLLLASAALSVLALTACGGGGGGGSASGGGSDKTLSESDAKNPSGNISWCIGKDTTGAFSAMVKQFNDAHANAKVKLIELPTSADDQRAQQVQRLRAKSSECDVLGIDTIWTAEYASQGWIYDLSKVMDSRKDAFIGSTVASAKYQGKYWAVPFNTNAGFLYYRDDKVSSAPKTWQQVYSDAQKDGGLVYQGARYEGLTVNFLELLYSAGGKAISDDGKKATIDSPEARDVLQFMVNGVKDGAVSKSVSTYQEEESRRAFEAGKAALERQWPYAYALGLQSPIKGEFKITTLPGWKDNPGGGVIGGYNLAINAYSKNPDTALAFADFVTQPAQQVYMASMTSLPPVLSSTYDNAAVKKALPFASELRKAVAQASPRPISPVYPLISEAIYNNVYSALWSGTSVDSALKKAQDQINRALQTF